MLEVIKWLFVSLYFLSVCSYYRYSNIPTMAVMSLCLLLSTFKFGRVLILTIYFMTITYYTVHTLVLCWLGAYHHNSTEYP